MTGRFPGSLAFGCLVIGLGNLTAIHQVPKSDVASRRTQNFLLFISSNNVNRQNVFQINWSHLRSISHWEQSRQGADTAHFPQGSQ